MSPLWRRTKWWTSRFRRCAWARARSSIVCLERREEMPAALEEIEEAEIEGIVLHDGRGPERVLGRNGKVVGLETVQHQVRVRRAGKFNPSFEENSESVIECDTVILAIGQAPKLDFLHAGRWRRNLRARSDRGRPQTP